MSMQEALTSLLKILPKDEVLRHFNAAERLQGLAPAERLQGLAPEDLEHLRQLPNQLPQN